MPSPPTLVFRFPSHNTPRPLVVNRKAYRSLGPTPSRIMTPALTLPEVFGASGPGFAVRSEVRLMYVWRDRPRLVGLLPRMSRGRLMGCDANRTDPWTGHGVAFWPAK